MTSTDFRPRERRRYDRVAFDHSVMLHRGSRPCAGTVRQISEGGAFIETEMATDLQRGERITLWLRLDEMSEREGVEAVVIYTRDNFEVEPGRSCPGLGVRFLDVDPRVEKALSQLVDTQRDAGRLIYDSRGKRAVEAASRLSEFLRAVVDNQSVLLVVLDEHGNVVLWSKAAEELTGLTRDEVLDNDRVWQILLPEGESREEMQRAQKQVMAANACVDGLETTIVTRERGQRVVSWDFRPLLEAGSPIGVIAMGRDVTAHRDVEHQLRQAQKLEAVGRLAGGIAHDFNNLLMAIMGYAEGLARDVGTDSPLRAGVDGILSCAARGSGLTRQLLAFSRRQVLSPVGLDVNELVVDVQSMLARLLGERVELKTSLDPLLWRVTADPAQMQQVLVNLVINARDAMPAGGAITVETVNVEVDAERARRYDVTASGPFVMLAVSDSGCGMDQETLGRIFEPFFTTKEPGAGTGLGLSTVYGIVRQSGGFVWVYSEPGRGSTFKVYLPRRGAADEERPMLDEGGLVRGGDETILLVEDDDSVRAVVADALRAYGYSVVEAADGERGEALVRERGREIALLLTDVVLPKLSGPDLAKRVAVERPDLKVLFMSGYTARVAVDQGLLDPERNYLEKPFPPSLLLRRVRQLLGGPR